MGDTFEARLNAQFSQMNVGFPQDGSMGIPSGVAKRLQPKPAQPSGDPLLRAVEHLPPFQPPSQDQGTEH